MNQLHAVSSQARVGPTFLNDITTMPSVAFKETEVGRLSNMPMLRVYWGWICSQI